MATITAKRNSAQAQADAIDRLARTAKDAGLPQESLLRFLESGYVPQPRQILFHAAARLCDRPDGPTDIGFGGARGGGKTIAVLAQLVLDDCQRQPGLKALFLRKVGKAARESFDDLRRQLLRNVPNDFRQQSGVMELLNGSRVVLGHFNAEKDIDAYLGLEYDVIAIEEATQLSLAKTKDIKTCLRTSKPNWRPRTYRTTNPGGIGHQHFKSEFVAPWRKHQQTSTRFIPATVRDNAFVNVEYVKNLETLPGWKRAAWLDGEWDIAAGQFFSTWRNDLHVCKPREPLKIPAHWPVWASMDYGFTHPTAVYLFTEFDGIIQVAAEHVEAKKLPGQHAAMITALFARHGVEMRRLKTFAAGADVFAQRGSSDAKTIADQYADHGIKLTEAPMDRVNGWAELLKRLGDSEQGIEPTIQISSSCVHLIECIPALQHDPNRPEDVLKADIDEDGNGGDDPADSLRYGLMARLKAAIRQGRTTGGF